MTTERRMEKLVRATLLPLARTHGVSIETHSNDKVPLGHLVVAKCDCYRLSVEVDRGLAGVFVRSEYWPPDEHHSAVDLHTITSLTVEAPTRSPSVQGALEYVARLIVSHDRELRELLGPEQSAETLSKLRAALARTLGYSRTSPNGPLFGR